MPGAVNAYAEDSLPTSRTCPVTHFVAVSAIRRIGVYGYSPSFVFSSPFCQSETLPTGIPIGGDDFSLTFLLFADFFFDTSPFPYPCRDHLVDGLWHREGRLLFRHLLLAQTFLRTSSAIRRLLPQADTSPRGDFLPTHEPLRVVHHRQADDVSMCVCIGWPLARCLFRRV